MSLRNYIDLNRRLNATEEKFKESWQVITEKFAAVKNGTGTELPTVEEIAKSKQAWYKLMEISQRLNSMHLN